MCQVEFEVLDGNRVQNKIDNSLCPYSTSSNIFSPLSERGNNRIFLMTSKWGLNENNIL